MATLEVCDLCNGKVKRQFTHVTIRGKVQLYEGNPPPPPEGFKYRDDVDRVGVKMVKMWDQFGKYQGMMQYMDKPKKVKEIQVIYDLCESCGQKLTGMLESLRRHYQLEAKEIQVIRNDHHENPFNLLGYTPDGNDE